MRTAVVRRSNRPEPLLARCVPNLQLDRLALQLNRPDLKVNTNRRYIRLRIRVVGKTQEKTLLTHALVTNQQKLEQIVVVWGQARHAMQSRGKKRRCDGRRRVRGATIVDVCTTHA